MPKKSKISLKLLLPVLVIALLFAVSVLSPLLPIYDPDKIDLDSIKRPPGMDHPFGTDSKGRDIFARVVYGGKVSIGVAIVAAFVSALIGFGIGIASGYFGGRLDTVLMSVVDFILSFPSLLLAIAISVILPPGIYTVMIAISTVGWTSFARLIRGHVLTIKDMPFVDAARAVGCSNLRIPVLHISSKSCDDGDQIGRVYYHRSNIELSGAWGTASNSNMGFHDKRQQGLYSYRAMDGNIPGTGNIDNCVLF